MGHLMTRGGQCGRPDGHTGQHRSLAGLEHRNAADRERYYALTGFEYNRLLLRHWSNATRARHTARAERLQQEEQIEGFDVPDVTDLLRQAIQVKP